jgi:hypothetical protein
MNFNLRIITHHNHCHHIQSFIFLYSKDIIPKVISQKGRKGLFGQNERRENVTERKVGFNS